MQRAFASLHPFVGVTVAVAPEQAVRAALVMVPAQELRDFEFHRLLEHELSTQAYGFGEGSLSGGRAEELFFEGLAGKLTFHCCPSLSV
jgi:hypothetical protein